MNERPQLLTYLARLTGDSAPLKPVTVDRLKGLPVYLARSYRFDEWSWRGLTLVLASSTTGPDDGQEDTAGLKAHQRTLAEHFHLPVALVLPALKAYRRDRLVQLGIPFIVPGTQLFIPPFADLCERYARQARFCGRIAS